MTELDGKPDVCTFSIVAGGKPYLLRIDYQELHYHTVRKFSGFNHHVDIQPPAAADVLDLSSLPSDAS
ncbi:hypothetical protein [Streptomyces olivochromogenes]|uniref:hypothetical protein n=1 Tax=Streptomyces olivochromogenes TaxID=1963 RepID=UPI001F2441B4|nr:hypothetical protein [Streptomyces olivochromogenes]MCF3132266.1 hypothetical protein [Streptomyces olivochromogenes]